MPAVQIGKHKFVGVSKTKKSARMEAAERALRHFGHWTSADEELKESALTGQQMRSGLQARAPLSSLWFNNMALLAIAKFAKELVLRMYRISYVPYFKYLCKDYIMKPRYHALTFLCF